MSVVTGALGSLAPKLAQLLHDEYKLQKGVRKQVESLSRELDSIYAFLSKVSDVPWHQLDEQVKLWAREVRETSYDMEDVLDTFLVRVDGGEPANAGRLKRAMKKLGKVFSKAKARHDIASTIEDIKKRLEEIAERRQKYKLDEMIMSKPITAASSAIDPRLTAMYKEAKELIGVDKSKDELISMLNLSQPDDDAPDKKIINKVSIVGVGGLGKTTLAKAVYDKLKPQYDCGAFVSIGRDHDLVKVFKDILFDLDKNRYENIHNTGRGVDLLIREVREFLENKRYFLVVDDVWDLQAWKRIKLVLVENNCGSKVIITTRKLDVAEEAGEVYKLKPLSYDDSRKLFCTRIFGADGKYFDNQPDDISNKILKKCGGIPLAIITLACLLVGKPKNEWPEVHKSIIFGSKGNMEVEDTMTIISFSYYDLPPHLRTCLLYLCTYPEDYLIEKDPLIWKWIAEGFIDGKQGTRLFELGETYFNDLINRSMIQSVEDRKGIVSWCRVHDIVLDLMRKLSSDENFIAIFGDNVEGKPALSNVRRVARHINFEAMVTTGILPKVRSYTAFRCSINSRDLFLRFKLLRVLVIESCKFKEGCHLEPLGDLLHLRYLRVICEDSDDLELPKEIGNLKLLQTLDVVLHFYGTLLPASIVQLTQLVRLCARRDKAPDGIGNLTSLEELRIGLHGNSETERFMKELGSLQELRVLNFGTIFGMDVSTQRYFLESLLNLKKIQHLEVRGVIFQADTAVWEAAGFVLPHSLSYLDLTIEFSKLPQCINPSRLPNLSHLKLYLNTMDEHDMENIARLPALCYLDLKLYVNTTDAYSIKINVRDSYFQKLRYFLINKLVQFELPNEEAASVSILIWNRIDAVPFGSRKRNGDDSRKFVASGLMINLEVLGFLVPLRALKDNNRDCGNIGLEYLPSLRELSVDIDCDGVCAEEVDDALAVLRNVCEVHPNNPTLYTFKLNEEKMVSTDDKEDEKQREEVVMVASLPSHTDDIDLGKLSPASS